MSGPPWPKSIPHPSAGPGRILTQTRPGGDASPSRSAGPGDAYRSVTSVKRAQDVGAADRLDGVADHVEVSMCAGSLRAGEPEVESEGGRVAILGPERHRLEADPLERAGDLGDRVATHKCSILTSGRDRCASTRGGVGPASPAGGRRALALEAVGGPGPFVQREQGPAPERSAFQAGASPASGRRSCRPRPPSGPRARAGPGRRWRTSRRPGRGPGRSPGGRRAWCCNCRRRCNRPTAGSGCRAGRRPRTSAPA